MRVEIVTEAQDELNAAVAYYEAIEKGLGIRLKEEVRATIRWIANHPEVPRLRAMGYRRVNLKVFQHYVAYFIWTETVWILAIAHGHQRPEYWMKRKNL